MSRARVEDRLLSVEEFMELPEEEGVRLELSRGRVVREPAPGPRHGRVTGRLYRVLWRHVDETGSGMVFFDTGFAIATDPPIVRVPDVAFVSAGRIPDQGLTDRFWELAPDLVVEVVSPSDHASALQQKALDYLDAGTRLVWTVDPSERTVTLYRSRSEIRILRPGESLEGADVVPGLRIPVKTLFE